MKNYMKYKKELLSIFLLIISIILFFSIKNKEGLDTNENNNENNNENRIYMDAIIDKIKTEISRDNTKENELRDALEYTKYIKNLF
jgi:hypothetical protein